VAPGERAAKVFVTNLANHAPPIGVNASSARLPGHAYLNTAPRRQRPGDMPYSRLNARLNAASDS
jgi:hypothetical protein